MRICGENMYAKHSVGYDDLETYFEVFSIWLEDRCLSWDETKLWCELLGLKTVPVLYEGEFFTDIYTFLPWDFKTRLKEGKAEGYVVRLTDEFYYDYFDMSVAKYVRKGHVQTDQHWMHSEIIPNKLRG